MMYAQRGNGRRSSFYSDYTFGCWTEEGELLPVGKAYSGITDEELKMLDGFVRGHTLNRFGPVREVEKTLVLEIAFDLDPRVEAPQIGRRHALPPHRPNPHRQAGRGGGHGRGAAAADHLTPPCYWPITGRKQGGIYFRLCYFQLCWRYFHDQSNGYRSFALFLINRAEFARNRARATSGTGRFAVGQGQRKRGSVRPSWKERAEVRHASPALRDATIPEHG